MGNDGQEKEVVNSHVVQCKGRKALVIVWSDGSTDVRCDSSDCPGDCELAAFES